MEKNRIIRLVAFAMCIITLIGIISSCSIRKPDNADNSGSTDTTSDSNSLYDENGYLKDSLDGLYYDGVDVNIITWDNNPYLFPLKTIENDQVIELVYNRDRYIEEKLGVKFKIIRKTSSASADKEHANALYNAMQSGSDSFDVCAAYAIWPPQMAYQGMLYDLNTLAYPETDKPWYPETDQWEVYDRLFYIASNSSVSSFNSMKVIYANTKLIADNKLEDVVDVVIDGRWTLEKMQQYSRYWLDDALNAKDEEKTYGILWGHRVMMEGFFYSAGFHSTEKDADGLPQLAYTESTAVERIDSFVETIRTMMNSPECHILQKQNMEYVKKHKTVFYAATLDTITEIAGDENIAIIPFPKLDDNQEEYYVSRDHGYDMFCVPVTASDAQLGAVIIEAIASTDYRTIGPDYFERRMKFRYSNSAKGAEIFELIRDSVSIDFITVNYKPMNGKIIENVLRNCVYPWTNGGKDGPVYTGQNFSSALAAEIDTHKSALASLHKVYKNFK